MHTTEQLNTALTGKYAVQRLIGEGGMATVYLARDLRHNRNVALKVLKPDLGAIVGVERFLSEIQVTANLQHPNLLPLFDSGAVDHLLFYVMPYIEGETLRHRIDREKQLPVDDAVRIAAAVASALDYAHRHGVIHRDLKPENILLHEGQPLVADFGIALAVSNAGGNRITQTGLSLGTPQYMSPEQATGDRVIDGRTDVYSLGAVTYEMLSGDPPHSGSTSQAIIARLLTERPRSIRSGRPSVSEQIEAAVEHALEKLPADRWATAKEFAEALQGTRIVVRAATTAAMPQAAARTAAATADFTILPNRSVGVREIAAWSLAAIAVIAFGLTGFRKPAPQIRAGAVTEFTVEVPDSMQVGSAGGAASMAISPDGAALIFVARESGDSSGLYMRQMDEQTVVRVRGGEEGTSPSFSQNGLEIAFTQRAQTGGRGASSTIARIPLRGGTPRKLTDSATGNGQLSWGEDGTIVFTAGGTFGRLMTMSSEGQGATLLAAPDSSRKHVRYGFSHVLPGSKAALITIWKVANVLDSATLGVVTIPGGRVTELGVRGTMPRYSPTGHIVYATSDAQINAVPFSLGKLRTTGTPVTIVEGVIVGAQGAAAFAISSNGTLAFRSGEARTGGLSVLFAVDRTGAERVLLEGQHMQWPRVAQNGKHVALAVGTGTRGGGLENPDVWRFEIGTPKLNRLTTDSVSTVAAWWPNADSIVIGKMWNTLAESVITVRALQANGREETLINIGRRVSTPEFGPLRGYASFSAGAAPGAPLDIWLVHTDSMSRPRPFLTEPYHESGSRVSPDGLLLAYVTDRTGRSEVYLRSIAGGSEEVPVSIGGGTQPVWSPGARELFWRSSGSLMSAQIVGNGRDLRVTRLDTLFSDVYRMGGAGSPLYDVMPGGREFLMIRNPGARSVETPIVVIVNWPALLTSRRVIE